MESSDVFRLPYESRGSKLEYVSTLNSEPDYLWLHVRSRVQEWWLEALPRHCSHDFDLTRIRDDYRNTLTYIDDLWPNFNDSINYYHKNLFLNDRVYRLSYMKAIGLLEYDP